MVEYVSGSDSTVLKNHIDYDAFGRILAQTDASVVTVAYYTGRYRDLVTGLQYNRARWYDADTGRWLSEDPIGFEAGDANLYRDVGNRVPFAVDPNGHGTETRKAFVFPDEQKTTIIKEHWEDYVAKTEKNDCCYEVGLNIQFEQVARKCKVYEVTYHTDVYGEIALALGITSGAATVAAGYSLLAPEFPVSKGFAAGATVVSGLAGVSAGVFGYLAHEYELGRDLLKTGYYAGWRNFEVHNAYVIDALPECPWPWDIDFSIEDNRMTLGGLPADYPDTLPSPSEIGQFYPDPNTWNDWSDREQTAGEGWKSSECPLCP